MNLDQEAGLEVNMRAVDRGEAIRCLVCQQVLALGTDSGYWRWALAVVTGSGDWRWVLAVGTGGGYWHWVLAVGTGNGYWRCHTNAVWLRVCTQCQYDTVKPENWKIAMKNYRCRWNLL